MPPRILVAHPYPDVYGADRVLLSAVTAFRDAGMDPTIVLPGPGPMTAWLDNGGLSYRFVDIPVLRRALLSPAGLLGLVREFPHHVHRVARTVAALDADLVYVNTITLPHWVVGSRRARVPVVAHVHESDERIHPAIALALVAPLLAADRIIVVSAAAKSFLCRTFPRLANRIVVVYNGVPIPNREFALPLEHAPAKLAVIGRFNPNKGQDLAIAAVQSLRQHGRDVRLTLAGSAFAGAEQYERLLRQSVSGSDLNNRIAFAGFCEDVWGLLSDTDIVLAPSRTDSLPLAVIEAMLAGRPVVAADVGGMRELLDDGRTGLLVGREDVAGLTRRVADLLDASSVARSLGANARLAAVERFSPARFERNLVAQVENALTRARNTRRDVISARPNAPTNAHISSK